MTRFPVPDVEDLPADVRERIDAEREDAGFVPNVFLALAYRPSHFRACFAYYDALVEETELEARTETIERTSPDLVDRVFRALLDAISDGTLPPGMLAPRRFRKSVQICVHLWPTL